MKKSEEIAKSVEEQIEERQVNQRRKDIQAQNQEDEERMKARKKEKKNEELKRWEEEMEWLMEKKQKKKKKERIHEVGDPSTQK
jgi:hypothetical protein